MEPKRDDTASVRDAYDEVATEYAARIADELAGKPLDRALLDVFAERLGAGARVCDAGCGPGHVTRYLRDRGADAFGVDLSPAMVAEAARLDADLVFEVGDLADLPVAPGSLDGVVAFYSLIHLPRERVAAALEGFRDRLRPGGLAFLAFHLGVDALHLDEWWGKAVSLDFTFFGLDEMRGYAERAGFEIDWAIERAPYADVEHPSRRGYLLARKPDEREDE